MNGLTPVVGLEGRYSATRNGDIYSHLSDRWLKLYLCNLGYYTMTVSLGSRPQKTKQLVHILIARTFLGECPIGHEVDHENRIRSDNRVANLRYLPLSGNAQNRGKGPPRGKGPKFCPYKGVIFRYSSIMAKKPWSASVKFNGKRHYCKMHATSEEAALAYDAKVIELRGKTATTNSSLGLLK